MEAATAGGGGSRCRHTHIHTPAERKLQEGWVGGHARLQGKCCFVAFFLLRPLYQLVFLTLNKPQGKAPDAVFSFDVSLFLTAVSNSFVFLSPCGV